MMSELGLPPQQNIVLRLRTRIKIKNFDCGTVIERRKNIENYNERLVCLGTVRDLNDWVKILKRVQSLSLPYDLDTLIYSLSILNILVRQSDSCGMDWNFFLSCNDSEFKERISMTYLPDATLDLVEAFEEA